MKEFMYKALLLRLKYVEWKWGIEIARKIMFLCSFSIAFDRPYSQRIRIYPCRIDFHHIVIIRRWSYGVDDDEKEKKESESHIIIRRKEHHNQWI